jgi:hypothetical protein
VSITINSVLDPPLAADDSASTSEDTEVVIDVAANDSDADGNLNPTTTNSTCAECTDPGAGTLLNNGDGTLTYSPDNGFSGPDSFVYEICDTDLMCDTATVSITVNPAAVILDAVSSGTTAGSSLTISHTTSGTDRLMLAGVSMNNDNLASPTMVSPSPTSIRKHRRTMPESRSGN